MKFKLLKDLSSSRKPITWAMAIFTNFKYFGTFCAIVCKKAKNLQSQVIGFIMLGRPMIDATLLFIINLKNDIWKSKNIEERTSNTNV
jgi:hypothetical protein